MSPARPSLELLRSLSDEHVLRALIAERRLTRAGIATRTGLSKPTVSDSVARLTEAGLLRDTGERTTGRGRVGSYYGVADDLGTALVVSIAPEGIVAEIVDVFGEVISREVEPVRRPARPAHVTRALEQTASRAVANSVGPVRLAVVSAADPVERGTGRLVHLPDAPFLLGELSPADTLAGLIDGPVTVDNDVNWAARAERIATVPRRLDDFAYLYLGEGLGCAIVADGEVVRGHGGLAGEIAHLITRGPHGRAIAFTDVFAELGLRQPSSSAIDVPMLLAAVTGAGAHARRVQTTITAALCDVVSALVALADPESVVIGGPWGSCEPVRNAVAAGTAQLPRPVRIVAAQVVSEAPLAGGRRHAVDRLVSAVVAVLGSM